MGTHNPWVGGSNPSGPITFPSFPDRYVRVKSLVARPAPSTKRKVVEPAAGHPLCAYDLTPENEYRPDVRIHAASGPEKEVR